MMNAPQPIIGTMKDLLDAIRQRKDELNLSNETIEQIGGLPERYLTKLLSPNPKRGLGYTTMGAVLGALGIGLQIVEDPKTAARVHKDWEQRKRIVPKNFQEGKIQEMPVNIDDAIQNWLRSRMREIGIIGNKSSKRRRNEMRRRVRQRNLTHRKRRQEAARMKGRHSPAEWEALIEACGNKCVRCNSSGSISKDHIVPLYQGGSDGLDNLQPLCLSCNFSKGPEAKDYRPKDWLKRTFDIAVKSNRKSLFFRAIFRSIGKMA